MRTDETTSSATNVTALSLARGIIRSRGGREAETPAGVLHVAIRERFDATLLSGMATEGEPLGPFATALSHQWHIRLRYLDELADRFQSTTASFRQAKGRQIEAFYPEGYRRNSRDVDGTVPDPAEFWLVVADLRHEGWTVDYAWMQQIDDGEPIFGVTLWQMSSALEFLHPARVDLTTADFWGDTGVVGPARNVEGSAVVRQFIFVAEEQLDREPISRDIFDTLMLCASLSPADRDDLIIRVGDLGVAPELLSLVDAATQFSDTTNVLASVELRRVASEALEARSRLARSARWRDRNPALSAQRRLHQRAWRKHSRWARRPRVLLAATTASAAFNAGHQVAGPLINETNRYSSIKWSADGYYLRLQTPLGEFMLGSIAQPAYANETSW